MKIGVSVRMGSVWPKISGARAHHPTTILHVGKLGQTFFHMVKNLGRTFFRSVTIHAFDIWTDGHVAHGCACIAAPCKMVLSPFHMDDYLNIKPVHI